MARAGSTLRGMRRTWSAGTTTEESPRRALHVVVVEAGERTTSALMAQLLGEAFTISRVTDVAAALHAAKCDGPDAVLIDAHVHAAHAIDIGGALRRCSAVPILVLAGTAETARTCTNRRWSPTRHRSTALLKAEPTR